LTTYSRRTTPSIGSPSSTAGAAHASGGMSIRSWQMSVSLAPIGPTVDHSQPANDAPSIGLNGLIALVQDTLLNFPQSLQAMPGNPVVAARFGFTAGLAMSVVGVLSIFRVFMLTTALAHLMNMYLIALGLIGAVVQGGFFPQLSPVGDFVRGQARCLSTSMGLACLQAAQCSLAFALGSVGHVLAGLVAVVACALQLILCHLQAGVRTIGQDGSCNFVSHPGPFAGGSAKTNEFIMQQCQ